MKKIKEIDYTYAAIEFADDIIEFLPKLLKDKEDESELLKFIEESGKKENFPISYNSLKQHQELYQQKITQAKVRVNAAETFLDFEFSDREKVIISLLLEILGVSNKEGNTIEERINNKEDLLEIEIEE